MAKKRRVVFYIADEWHKALASLAGTCGVSAEEIVLQSLPDDAVAGLFFRCRIYLPELRWDEVAQVGRDAIREHLRAQYMKGFEQHLARLGMSLESTAEEVEAAQKRALDELRADTAHPLLHQIARAEEDSAYLGCLYDAWKRANAGEAGYTVAQVDGHDAAGQRNGQLWAVLKDGQIV